MSDPREGWYPDPLGEADLRRWDGVRWTTQTRARPESASAESDRPEASHASKRRGAMPMVLGVIALLAGAAALLWYLGFLGDDSTVDDGALAGEDTAQEGLAGEGTTGDSDSGDDAPVDAPAELVVPDGFAAWSFEDPSVAFALPDAWNDATARFADFVDPAAFAADGDAATLIGVYASGADRQSPDDTFVIHVTSADATLADQHATVLSGLGLPADDSPASETSAVGYPTLRTHVEAGVEGFDHTVDVVTLDAGGQYVTFACNAYAEGAECAALDAIVDSALIG